MPDVHDRRPQRGWIQDGYQAPRPLHQVPEVATLTFAKYAKEYLLYFCLISILPIWKMSNCKIAGYFLFLKYFQKQVTD